jgi:hypothetical protein
MSRIFCFLSGFSWAVGWYGIIDDPSKAFTAAVTLLMLAAIVD